MKPTKRSLAATLAPPRRVGPKKPEARPGRGASAAFEEAVEAAQRAPAMLPFKLPAPALTPAKPPQGKPALELEPRVTQKPDPSKRAERGGVEANAPRDAQGPASPAFPEPAREARTAQAPAPLEAPAPVTAPRQVDPERSLLQLAIEDASLRLDVRAQVVKVALDTEAAGPLNLELRVHEQRADLHVEGPASPLMAQHEPALREVLSSQGLSLGDFSLGERARQAEYEAPDEEASPRRRAPGAAADRVMEPAPGPRHAGRIDVEA